MGLARTKEKLFDLRTVNRHIDSGDTTSDDLKKYVADLKDVSDNAEIIPTEVILEEEQDGPKRRKSLPSYKKGRRTIEIPSVPYDEEDDADAGDESQQRFGVGDNLATRTYDELKDGGK